MSISGDRKFNSNRLKEKGNAFISITKKPRRSSAAYGKNLKGFCVCVWPVSFSSSPCSACLGMTPFPAASKTAARWLQQSQPHSLTDQAWLRGKNLFLDCSWNSLLLDMLGHLYISEPNTKWRLCTWPERWGRPDTQTKSFISCPEKGKWVRGRTVSTTCLLQMAKMTCWARPPHVLFLTLPVLLLTCLLDWAI